MDDDDDDDEEDEDDGMEEESQASLGLETFVKKQESVHSNVELFSAVNFPS